MFEIDENFFGNAIVAVCRHESSMHICMKYDSAVLFLTQQLRFGHCNFVRDRRADEEPTDDN